jgi:hypothetical protein
MCTFEEYHEESVNQQRYELLECILQGKIGKRAPGKKIFCLAKLRIWPLRVSGVRTNSPKGWVKLIIRI